MDNDYTRIAWPEVRKGDVLMHENGDRLTVRHVDGVWVSVPGSQRNRHYWEESGFLLYRRKPELPTVPGAYMDKNGKVWLRDYDWDGEHWIVQGCPSWLRPDEVTAHAPFTRLVPMPTEEQVREAADSGLADRSEFAATAVTNAVMALLEAGQNGEGEQ